VALYLLGRGADTAHGESDGDGQTLSLVEELGLEKDLSIGDRDDVGGNVGGHISCLGLDDRECGQGPTPGLAVHLGSTLQQAGVKVEHIIRVGLVAGGTTKEEGHLAVGNGLLIKVVIEDDGMLAIVAEVLPHGCSGVGGKELGGGGVGCGGGSSADWRTGMCTCTACKVVW
jgi:hypothetical protein